MLKLKNITKKEIQEIIKLTIFTLVFITYLFMFFGSAIIFNLKGYTLGQSIFGQKNILNFNAVGFCYLLFSLASIIILFIKIKYNIQYYVSAGLVFISSLFMISHPSLYSYSISTTTIISFVLLVISTFICLIYPIFEIIESKKQNRLI